MTLSHPPIGLAAVQAFYTPLELESFVAPCGPHTFRVTSHVRAAPNIKAFFWTVEQRGLAHLIHSFDGCYVDRPKRLSRQKSMHAYGAAIDVNASSNEQGTHGDMPAALVQIAKELGFWWGGEFYGRYRDAMHFQLGVDFPLNGRPAPRVTYAPALNKGAPAVNKVAPPVNKSAAPKDLEVWQGGQLRRNFGGALRKLADGHYYLPLSVLPELFAGATVNNPDQDGKGVLRAP